MSGIRQASPDPLTAVVNDATAEKIRRHFAAEADSAAKIALRILNHRTALRTLPATALNEAKRGEQEGKEAAERLAELVD